MNIQSIKSDIRIPKQKNAEVKSNSPDLRDYRLVTNNSLNIQGNYNVAFTGLFNFNKPINALNVFNPIQMEPKKEYLVEPDAILMMDRYPLNLAAPNVKSVLDSLKENQSLIFGREGVSFQDMPLSVSRYHLKIKKTKGGKYTAEDIGSKYGTKITPNIQIPDLESGEFYLFPSKKYVMPINSELLLGKYKLKLTDIRKKLSSLQDGQSFIIGRSSSCDLQIDDNSVSRRHIQIEKMGKNLLVKDLGSLNGTKFAGISNIAEEDYSDITEKTVLKKEVPTIIPNDCQLYLGNNYAIDMRNKNITDLLNTKPSVVIGRSADCDVIVDNFYSKVSRTHLKLRKYKDKIIATDLGAMNDTVVIPKNKIKAFYDGIENIQMSQKNIGDCFLLAPIYALSRNKKGQEILNKMVKVMPDGSYLVQFYECKPIIVAPDELDGQSKSDGSKKYCVSGELGLRAIERAYAKLLKYISVSNSGKTMFADIDSGGYPDKTLFKISGITSDRYKITQDCNIDAVLNKIGNDNPRNHVLLCTTPNLKEDYSDPQKRFCTSHAYAVKYINPQKRIMCIINPHNTKRDYIVSWDEFKLYFSNLYDGKVN